MAEVDERLQTRTERISQAGLKYVGVLFQAKEPGLLTRVDRLNSEVIIAWLNWLTL